MKIALGSDHAGVEYKKAIVEHLKNKGIETQDFGPQTTESVDYPDYIHPVADAVEKGDAVMPAPFPLPHSIIPMSASPFSTASATGCM